jgi:nucleotide-binding universal stress UspA family protein
MSTFSNQSFSLGYSPPERASRNLNVDLKRIVTRGIDVANIILSYAADVSADFIVAGGYGHSQLREFILGGVTRGLLSSMMVPTLMSH